MMRNTTVPMMNSAVVGMSGFSDPAARNFMPSPLAGLGGVEDERGDQPDQREGLGQREPDPHAERDPAGGLRLAGHRPDGVAEDEPDRHAPAAGRPALPR